MTYIRVLHQDPAGKIFDGGIEFGLEIFAGQLPAIGDMILNRASRSGRIVASRKTAKYGPWSGECSIRGIMKTAWR